MNSSRLIIILVFALIGASVGTALQALRLTGKPQEFRSMAKLVAGGQLVFNDSLTWREQQADFYGTIIETIESAEMKRRALERVRALNPGLKDSDVEIRVAQTKGSAIFNVLATGLEPKYTRIFLDALLDEFIAFRQSVREQAQGKVLQQFLQEVASRQKKMERLTEELEKARASGDTLSTKAELERLVTRLNSLRNQRDDLRFQLKLMDAKDEARAPLEAKLSATVEEVQSIEGELKQREPGISELRGITEKYEAEKALYQRMLEKVDPVESALQVNADYVAIQERATPASENVEDWVLPVAVGAGGLGFVGGLAGFLLSLIILRSPKPPQMPAAV